MPILVLLCAAQFMVILDITVVNVALPSIQADLEVPIKDLQWVVTAYTLTFGGLLLLGGRAADLLGRRRVFLGGVGLFTAASLGAALASSSEALLVARVGQGLGAALLSPSALSLITTVFAEGPERNRALTAWSAVAAGGAALGVLAGGVLTETVGWEGIFLINVPIGLGVVLLALRLLPAAAPTRRARADVLGALLATTSLAALIYALVEAPSAGWSSSQTLGLLAGAAAGLAAFVAVEGRVRDPLVRLSVFRRRPTTVGLILMICGMGTMVSTFYFLSLYLQQVLGHSALRTGLEFLPGAVLVVAAAHVGGRLVASCGPKLALASGLALAAVGALLLSGVSAGGSYAADVLPGLLVLDLGIGLSAPAIFITAMSGVGDDEAGAVSGLVSTAHEIGAALVLPVLSTIAATGVVEASTRVDLVEVTAGFGDAFRGAAVIVLAAAVMAVAGLRRGDIAPGTAPALAHH